MESEGSPSPPPSRSPPLLSVPQQTGEYATDEEDGGPPGGSGGDKSIEVFDLPENEDVLTPSEVDAGKLYQKFREVRGHSSPSRAPPARPLRSAVPV